MAKRAMNNQERANAKTLKEKGFDVFWFDTHNPFSQANGYWATHPKLICMYDINTAFSMALEDLSKIQITNNNLYKFQKTNNNLNKFKN